MKNPVSLPEAKAHWKHKLRKVASDEIIGASVRCMIWSIDQHDNPVLDLGVPVKWRYTFLRADVGVAARLEKVS
jgi:hypothetical protein